MRRVRVAELDARLLPPEEIGHEADESGLGEFLGVPAHRVVDAPDLHDGDDAGRGKPLGQREPRAHLAVAQLYADRLRRHSFKSAVALPARMRACSSLGVSSAFTAVIVPLMRYAAALAIERRVGREEAMRRREEIVAAARRRDGAVQRRVGIEHVEIVERRALQAALLGKRVLGIRAPENLAEAQADLVGEIGDHPAHVMRDDLELRQLVVDAGIDQPRHRRARLVGPAEDEPDLVLRLRLAGIVGEIGAADRMDPHRQVVLAPCAWKIGRNCGAEERLAEHVGEDLDAARAELVDGARRSRRGRPPRCSSAARR